MSKVDTAELEKFVADQGKVTAFLVQTATGNNVNDWNSRVWHSLRAGMLADFATLGAYIETLRRAQGVDCCCTECVEVDGILMARRGEWKQHDDTGR